MKVRSVLTVWLLFAMVVVMALNTFRGSSGPHGGIVKIAGDYKIEMLNSSFGLSVYLLDARERAIGNDKIMCKVEFLFPDSSSITYVLKPYGADGFEIDWGTFEFYTCKIYFYVDGKSVSAWFDNPNTVVRNM
jgi:hypothetical protein